MTDEDLEKVIEELTSLRVRAKDDSKDAVIDMHEALAGDDKALRMLAERAFNAMGSNDENSYLKKLSLLTDKNTSEESLESLVHDLKSEFKVTRSKAIVALGKKGEPAVDTLISLLENGDWLVRAGATLALGTMGKEAVKPLMLAVENGGWDVRRRAVRVLGWIGDEKAVPALLNALQDKDQFVQLEAAEALACIGGPLSKAAVNNFIKDNSL